MAPLRSGVEETANGPNSLVIEILLFLFGFAILTIVWTVCACCRGEEATPENNTNTLSVDTSMMSEKGKDDNGDEWPPPPKGKGSRKIVEWKSRKKSLQPANSDSTQSRAAEPSFVSMVQFQIIPRKNPGNETKRASPNSPAVATPPRSTPSQAVSPRSPGKKNVAKVGQVCV